MGLLEGEEGGSYRAFEGYLASVWHQFGVDRGDVNYFPDSMWKGGLGC